MSYNEQSDKLAGPIGLLKQCVVTSPYTGVSYINHWSRFITRIGRETAEDATQLFGGRGITVTGMGKLIENVRPRLTPLVFSYSPTGLYSSIGLHHMMRFLVGVRKFW